MKKSPTRFIRRVDNKFTSASLDLNFQNMITSGFDSRITFTRGSNATLFDGSGNLVYAPHNLLTYSAQFDNAAWGKTNATVTANDVVAPDGTLTGDKLVENTAVSVQHTCSTPVSATTGQAQTFSVYAKAGERTRLDLAGAGFSAQGFVATFDLLAGTVVVNTGNKGFIQSVGNGWYRCSISFTPSIASAYQIQLNNGTSTVYTGDGTSGIYIWGAQLNAIPVQGGVTSSLSTYYPTVASAYYGPRLDHNPTTLQSLGLLIEEQRTNLLLRSEDFTTTWTAVRASASADQTNSPAGTLTADKIIEDSSASTTHFVRQDVAITSGVSYAWSVFAKADTRSQIQLAFGADNGCFPASDAAVFTLTGSGTATTVAGSPNATIQALANGWYRCSVRATSAATATGIFRQYLADGGTASYTGDGTSGLYLWGAQLEAGAFPTSYIPTVAATVTRNADVASMTGTNFSSWYNATEGTLFADAVPQASNVASVILADINTTVLDRISLAKLITTGNASLAVLVANVTQVSTNSGPWTATGKFAGAFKLNDFASSLNGSAAATDTSGTIPAVTQLFLGRRADGANILNGHIRRIAYYSVCLSNAQLQALTR